MGNERFVANFVNLTDERFLKRAKTYARDYGMEPVYIGETVPFMEPEFVIAMDSEHEKGLIFWRQCYFNHASSVAVKEENGVTELRETRYRKQVIPSQSDSGRKYQWRFSPGEMPHSGKVYAECQPYYSCVSVCVREIDSND